MAARDIFSLHAPMAPSLVRILYVLAMILIVLAVILGVARGISAATRMPALPPLPATAAAPQAPLPPMPGIDARRGRRFTGRGFAGPALHHAPRPFGIGARRQPALFGALLILRSLVLGFVALLVVRILAEMALAVVNLPRRGDV